jgi:hypothetical protein
VEWLLKRFGPRLEVVMGTSVETVPAYAAMHPDVACDVLFIDGGHSGEVSNTWSDVAWQLWRLPICCVPVLGWTLYDVGAAVALMLLWQIPMQDMINMIALANRTHHVLILDDTEWPDIRRGMEVSASKLLSKCIVASIAVDLVCLHGRRCQTLVADGRMEIYEEAWSQSKRSEFEWFILPMIACAEIHFVHIACVPMQHCTSKKYVCPPQPLYRSTDRRPTRDGLSSGDMIFSAVWASDGTFSTAPRAPEGRRATCAALQIIVPRGCCPDDTVKA